MLAFVNRQDDEWIFTALAAMNRVRKAVGELCERFGGIRHFAYAIAHSHAVRLNRLNTAALAVDNAEFVLVFGMQYAVTDHEP